MSDLKVQIFRPVRHDESWSLTIWRFGKVEEMSDFPTEAKLRSYLRRAGYPFSKVQVPVAG